MDYFDIFTTDARNNAIFLPTFLFQGKALLGEDVQSVKQGR